MKSPFAREAVAAASPEERVSLLKALEQFLFEKFSMQSNQEVMVIVEHLRGLGHDLWSFDECDDFEIWCPDYTRGSSGIHITFFYGGSCEVGWTNGGGG
jgi:hypothetical protein